MKIKQILENGDPKNKEIAYNFFVEEKGYSPEIAAGIVGNLMQESHSNLNTQALGFDGTGSYGVAQWLGPRKEKLKQIRPNDYSTLRGQLEFIDWELNNTEKRASRKLNRAKTAEEAALIFSKHYERPHKDYAANNKRVSYANDLLKNSGNAPTGGGLGASAVAQTNSPKIEPELAPKMYQGQQSYAYNNKSANATYADITLGEDTTPKTVEVKQNGLDEAQVRKMLDQERSAMEEKFINVLQQSMPQQRNIAEQEYAQPQEDLYNYVDIQNFADGGELLEKETNYLDEILGINRDPTPKPNSNGANQFGATINNKSLYEELSLAKTSNKPKEEVSKKPVVNPFPKEVEGVAALDYNNFTPKDDFSSKVGIEKVQNKLIAAGYDLGATGADGDNGIKTKEAYEKYLKGVAPANGKPNPFGEIKGFSNYADFNQIGEQDDLKTKAGIEKVQKKLVDAGYDLGAYGKKNNGIDGLMGDMTKKAYAKYNSGTAELSLEQEEAAIRAAVPKRGSFQKATDYITGNIDEYIINPLKMKANNILPETLDFNPNLATTVSDYDNTEGSRPYLLNNKSLSEIRQEKNISFNQISKNRGGNSTLPLNLKKRILNSTYSQGYGMDPAGFLERFSNPESLTGESQLKKLPGKQGTNREDIFLMYSGLPQRHDTFTASSFKAGESSDTNVTFKDPKVVLSYLKTAALNTDLFEKLANGEITPESIAASNSGKAKGGDKVHKAGFRDPQNVMWNATFGIGFDKAGEPYLSFYDNWDLKGKDDWSVSKGIYGSPIEVYDRIPLTKGLIQRLSKGKKQKQSNAESDAVPNTDLGLGKTIDTLFAQQYKENSPEIERELGIVLSALRNRMK
jgi:hypothetical protein